MNGNEENGKRAPSQGTKNFVEVDQVSAGGMQGLYGPNAWETEQKPETRTNNNSK